MKKENTPDLILPEPAIIWSEESGMHWQVHEVPQELSSLPRAVGVSHDVLGGNKIQLY